ncbi:MAG: hypothetical protein AAF568_11770 [Pseudomonadota bacterium]
MNVATCDRLAYVDALKSSGISEEHARAHASALDAAMKDTVATKSDVAAVSTDVVAIRSEMEQLEFRLTAKIEAAVAKLRQEMAEIKTDLERRIITLLLAQTAILVAVIKLI